jgi:hypothetical protein
MKRALTLSLLLLALAAAGAGCAHRRTGRESLPAVQYRDNADALRILRERAAAVKTVQSRGTITFIRPDGASVRMDLAMVSQPPDHLRLRAWKLGRAIFDLTLTTEGLWLLSPEDASLRDRVQKANVGAAEIARNWSMLSGEFFDRSDLKIERQSNDLVLTAQHDHELTLRCHVDARAVVPWLYLLQDAGNKTRFSLNLDDYRMLGGLPYPHRIQADSEGGRIIVQLEEVELNEELAPAAFKPPRRAEKLP